MTHPKKSGTNVVVFRGTKIPAFGSNSSAGQSKVQKFISELSNYRATSNSEAHRLTGWVYGVSAALAWEDLSSAADRAGFRFPINPLNGDRGTLLPAAKVVVAGLTKVHGGALAVSPIKVDAQFFYALGSELPTGMKADHRYKLANCKSEEEIVTELTDAIDAGVLLKPLSAPVPDPEALFRDHVPPPIGRFQAALLLHALGEGLDNEPVIDINRTEAADEKALFSLWREWRGSA